MKGKEKMKNETYKIELLRLGKWRTLATGVAWYEADRILDRFGSARCRVTVA